jgi:hypothetical protein
MSEISAGSEVLAADDLGTDCFQGHTVRAGLRNDSE